MTGVRGPLVLLATLLAACGGGERKISNPARLVLVNRTGSPVEGAVLRFDRELTRIEPKGSGGFRQVRLRLSPADTVRLTDGRLEPGDSVRYEVTGAAGPPGFLEGRWLVAGKVGPKLTHEEVRIE